jgi:hypothetical protein
VPLRWFGIGWDGIGWTSRLDSLVNRAALPREVAWVVKRDGLERDSASL